MSNRLRYAEQEVVRAACALIAWSERPGPVAMFVDHGTALISAVHVLRKIEEEEDVRLQVEREMQKHSRYVFVVREGLLRGKGRYVHVKSNELLVKWTSGDKNRAEYGLRTDAEEDAAIHGGRVVRVSKR